MTKLYSNIIFISIFFCFGLDVQGQQFAFPGAEGFGRYTTGGRGGEVYEVTQLGDSGPGSFREGINLNVPRTIVFRVSGTIHLLSELRITNGNLTVAGQTAPGDGIALKGHGVVVAANNIIIRYIRFRPGDISGGEPDAIWGRNQKDIIIDHCSMSWAVDEISSFYDNENFTMQWCLLSESLYESQHEKGRHGYGGIWGGQGATFHHNILAHHSSRNPRFNGSRYSNRPDLEIVDFRNNVIYNWGGNGAYGGEGGNQNMVANYFKPGPATSGEKRYRILDAYPLDGSLGKWYVEDNYVEGYPDVTADNWNGGVQRLTPQQVEDARVYQPFDISGIQTQTAEEAYESILEQCGATLPGRDAVDSRIIQEIESGTVTFGGAYGSMKGIIDSQEQVGGWPQLFSAPAPIDSDHDGIPDQWEIENALDPEDPDDGKAISDDGYSNLERYLFSLADVEPVDFMRHPTNLIANQILTTKIELAWVNNTDEEAEVILERSRDNQLYQVIAELPTGTTSYLDEGLEPGVLYFYRLKSFTQHGESAFSNPESFTTVINPIDPEPGKLVGYWSFDAVTGKMVHDKSSYENHAQLVNSEAHKWIPGKANNAVDLTLASASSHILVPHADHLDFGNSSFSISFWMKVSESITQAYIFHKGSFIAKTGTEETGKWYGLEIKNNLVRFAVDDDVAKTEVAFDNTGFFTGEWTHVVAVRNRENKTLNLYRNGFLLAEITDETNGDIGQTQDLIIANSFDLDLPFKGIIDEFRIYAYSLNASEIVGLYENIPFKASNPTPAHASDNVTVEEAILQWDGNAPLYDIYFGTAASGLTLEAENITVTTYPVSGLSVGKEYFWRIDSKGSDGTTIVGDIWTFVTESITAIRDIESNTFRFYPNPVSNKINIEFVLEKREPVVLSIFDVYNQKIQTITDATLKPGFHHIQMEFDERQLDHLVNGVYYCVYKTSGKKLIKRMLLLR